MLCIRVAFCGRESAWPREEDCVLGDLGKQQSVCTRLVNATSSIFVAQSYTKIGAIRFHTMLAMVQRTPNID